MPELAFKKFLDNALCRSPYIQRLVVGFSGGLDSTVLLHLLMQMQSAHKRELLAVHIHHGLSSNADAWANHAVAVCAAWQIPCTVRQVEVMRTASLEAAARLVRRDALCGQLQAGDALLLAQHQNDQAETVLFRLLRGSGVAGLSAMRGVSTINAPEGDNWPLWRPLLGVSRGALEQYARQHELTWIDDESNTDTRFSRNFLRHDILPALQQQWPAAVTTLAATARRMQEADQLLQELAEELAAVCIDGQQRLLIPAVQALSSGKQGLVLRYWLKQQGFRLPDEAVLHQITSAVISAREDAAPRLAWTGCEVRRYRQHLYAMAPRQDIEQKWATNWDMLAPLMLPDGRYLRVESTGDIHIHVRVRFRQGGERLSGRGMTHDLKKLLQASAIPPWERNRLPLLFCGDALVAVAGTSLRSPEWPNGIQLMLEPAVSGAT